MQEVEPQVGPRSRANAKNTAGDDTMRAAEGLDLADAGRGAPVVGRLDPGWATLIAAAFAFLGTVVTVVAQCSPGKTNSQRTTVTTSAVTQAVIAAPTTLGVSTSTSIAPTEPSTLPVVTSTSATSATSVADSATTSVSTPTNVPLVQVISALSPAQQAVVGPAYEAILKVADSLPLIVADRFATNDYAWPESTHTYDGGLECSWAIADAAYKTTIHTVNGGAWCRNGLSKVASNFLVAIEQQLETRSNSEIGLLFRVVDDRNYALSYSPQTQTMRLSYTGPEGEVPILSPTYVASINRSGSNQIALLVIGSSMMVSVNGTLAVSISNETRITSAGQVLVRLQLNEANANETLSLTRFDLRGQ